MADSDQETPGIRVEKFRTARSEPAGVIVLELAQNDGVGFQFAMTLPMAQQLVKSLQDRISDTKEKLN